MQIRQDRFRQAVNLILALSPPITTFLAFARGTSFEEATGSGTAEPLIVPADYAFIIWSLIYLGGIAFGIYQALPSQRHSALLRRMGLYPAFAFLGTTLWLVMARLGLIWLTVACIIEMLISLAGVMAALMRHPAPLTRAERYLVTLPLSIFAGWVTVATFANLASALKYSGWLDVALSEESWTILMLALATAISSLVTFQSRGNTGYALTVIWALVAIVVANFQGERNTTIATVAAVGAVIVAATLWASRRLPPGDHGAWQRWRRSAASAANSPRA